MSFTHRIEEQWSRGSSRLSASNEYTGDEQLSINASVPDSSADKEVALTLDVSEIKPLFILSSTDMTLETNDGTTPDDTIALKAGKALIWRVGDYHANPFSTDITALFLTTGSVGEATFKLEVLFDGTP